MDERSLPLGEVGPIEYHRGTAEPDLVLFETAARVTKTMYRRRPAGGGSEERLERIATELRSGLTELRSGLTTLGMEMRVLREDLKSDIKVLRPKTLNSNRRRIPAWRNRLES